ncbi:MAG TPA: Fic family protein [Allosphingosinicella sp.]
MWQLLDAGQLEPLTLCEISRLAGGADAIRTVRATASRFLSGQAIEYLKPSLILGRLAPLLTRVQVRETELPPIAHALGVFFETLLIHPFADGNGRLARLLFQGSLHQTVKLRAPVFPLGPSLFANRNAAIRAYLAWEFDSSAVPLLRFVAAAVDSIDQFVTELALNHCKR